MRKNCKIQFKIVFCHVWKKTEFWIVDKENHEIVEKWKIILKRRENVENFLVIFLLCKNFSAEPKNWIKILVLCDAKYINLQGH